MSYKKCEQCGNELNPDKGIYTAVGVTICHECNDKNEGTVSLDLVMDKIIGKKSKEKENRYKGFSYGELYIMLRHAVESSYDIMFDGDYTEGQKNTHAQLMAELVKELKNRGGK